MPRGVSRYDEAQRQGRLWTPAMLRPALWHDAADVSTITIATGVSEWRDKSGNGGHATQATAANQPAFSATAFAGLPGLIFDGVNDTLVAITTAMRNTTHGAYWVWRRLGPGTTGDLYKPTIGVKSNPDGVDRGSIHYVKSSNFGASYPYYAAPGTGSYDLTAGSAYATGVSYVQSFQSNTTGWGVWRNGLLEGTTSGISTPNTAVNGYTFGAQLVNPRYSNIVLSEFVMIPSVTTANRRAIEGYLAWKWRVTLEPSHPHVNRPPLIGD